jgi:ABC-type antimicrobial peptide transport system permease subunit
MYGTGLQLYFFVKTDGRTVPAVAAVRRAMLETDAAAGTPQTLPLLDWNEIMLVPQKAAAALLAALGLIATLLAAAGLYGVMAYSVSQRTREIGIRMALGAQPRDVLGATLRHGLGLTIAGLAAGIAAALALAPLVSSLLVRLSASDPRTFAQAAAVLIGVALVASYLPARRATKVDPQAALRRE